MILSTLQNNRFIILSVAIFLSLPGKAQLKGKWIASYQEHYAVFSFKKRTLDYCFYGPKGKVNPKRFRYRVLADTLVYISLKHDSVLRKESFKVITPTVLELNGVILQRESALKKGKPIINKPDF